VARMNRISITLCALLFTTLPFTSHSWASTQTRLAADVSHVAKKSDKKKSAAKTQKKGKARQKAAKNSRKITSSATARALPANRLQRVALTAPPKCAARKGRHAVCMKRKGRASGTLADAHKLKVQKATTTAMNKLMKQIGKPYRWGGSSPRTGFDCSGLVYYAYKDLVKIRIPRTANEMYHLRDAAPIERGELKNGDLVFFRTQGRGAADHVGVYVGDGKFIQSPRSGREIQITSLSDNYWQRHYVGARRVMTPGTIR
jgi:murein DD-endopeptidase